MSSSLPEHLKTKHTEEEKRLYGLPVEEVRAKWEELESLACFTDDPLWHLNLVREVMEMLDKDGKA